MQHKQSQEHFPHQRVSEADQGLLQHPRWSAL